MSLLLRLLLLIAALTAAGMAYAEDRGLSAHVAAAVLPAFLAEATLYALSGFPEIRLSLERREPLAIASVLIAAAPISWILLSIALHHFSLVQLLSIIGLAAVASLWYVVLPRNLATDLSYLVLMAAPVLLKVFDQLYPDPADRIPGQILGLLMWYRTGLLSVLCIRRMEGINFGFVPSRKDWAIGLRNYLWFTPPALGLALAIGFVHFRHVTWDPRLVALTIFTFIGVLCVLAVAEEFFFRGLLQQQLSRLFRGDVAGLIVASVIFGAAHLPYHAFPNWKFALLATFAGIFYGRAYIQARSIRAAMVTHALVVTTMKMFLST